ncbi:MAG: stage IV sporulation protein A [Ruminococcaceae bacterium]|nr:stage IV sporulation protein A [Oscillospiraceae bacterium]
MASASIYQDIARRTGGEIYVGVVGPVRTGKSTLIKKFMEGLVLPGIADEYDRKRARDELPQSAGGKTVMTTEPKFIPEKAVTLSLPEMTGVRVRLIDCVGYLVPEALGQTENGEPRMVHTPWDSEPVPFVQAAETGTRKVITDHATIGLLVTCDGSICEIPRHSYEEAEERVANEMKSLGKPFAVILNSAHPNAPESVALAEQLEEKYASPVALVNCTELNAEDIRHILEMILQEFPVKELKIELPSFTLALEDDHWLMQSLREEMVKCACQIHKMGQVSAAVAMMGENDSVGGVRMKSLDPGSGVCRAELLPIPGLYYRVLSELTGLRIDGDEQLVSIMRKLAAIKEKYDRVSEALEMVEQRGYGIVMPTAEELRLEDPKIIKQPGGYGVKLKASAPSVHMIKADIETELNPIVGSEQQSEELIRYLMREFENDPAKIWQTNMFGTTLYELVSEGLSGKLQNMPEDARTKLSQTLSRIINEGTNGLVCILL